MINKHEAQQDMSCHCDAAAGSSLVVLRHDAHASVLQLISHISCQIYSPL
jgi:hypothetical protein